MARDDFAGQVGGGGVNNFEFTVTDAWFGISQSFTDKTGLDTIFLHWIGTTDLEDERFQRLDAEGFHPSFEVAVDWEATNNGQSIKYDGASKKPRVGKWYGRLCDKALDLTEGVANTDQDPLAGDATVTDAKIWVGTKWFMEDVTFEGLKNPTTGAAVSHLMPTKYLGKGAVSTSPTASAPTADATSAPAASNGALRDQVVALARSAGSYPEFQAAALALPGVSADSSLVVEIADQSKLFDSVRA